MAIVALGYWRPVVATVKAVGKQGIHGVPSMRAFESQAAVIFALISTGFLKVAYAWAADRQGRPLSALSLLLFPLLNAVFEGCALLAVFDLGR